MQPFENQTPMLTLNSKQVRFLRSAGHALNAVVMIGNNGLTEEVLREIDRSLNAHELIKIKVAGDQRELRVQMLQEICDKLGAAAIQHIGKQLVVYRPADKPKITLP
jgi:RNA-binding protein